MDIKYICETYQKAYDKYKCVNNLAKKYGVKSSDIFKVLLDEGIIGKGVQPKEDKAEAKTKTTEPVKKKSRDPYTEEEKELIRKLKAEGKTWGEISDITGRSAKSMSNLFSEGKSKKGGAKNAAKRCKNDMSAPAKAEPVEVNPDEVNAPVQESEPVTAAPAEPVQEPMPEEPVKSEAVSILNIVGFDERKVRMCLSGDAVFNSMNDLAEFFSSPERMRKFIIESMSLYEIRKLIFEIKE